MAKGDPISITFKAHFSRFGTLIDGGVRLALDMHASDAQALVDILKYQSHVFQVALIPVPDKAQEVAKQPRRW